jgi:hypothetical protein
MSYVQDIARDALKTAYADLVKARRGLLVAAGVLALIHLLSVYPYLEASRSIAAVEASMADNDRLLAQITPEIERLKEASNSAGARLNDLLFAVTDEMIASFAVLRDRIVRAMQGDASPGASPDISFPPESQFDPAQQMQQMPQLQVQQMAPVGRQLSPVAPNLALQAAPNLLLPGPEFRRDDLQPILEALVAGEPGAEAQLTTYARENIVAAAYSRAQREWSERIRPAYLDALAAIELQTRQSAENAPASLAETAAALRQTVADVAAARETVEAIEITSDASVDAALGTDWWRTVEGKGAFADAVADSINERMRSIAETAESPSVAIRKSVALQEELRNTLRSRQEELESQFAEQRKQLASLSGAAGVVPIDLASFIGLFPLVVGLVLGFMLVRVGETRRQGALAATDLANAAADDADTRRWLTRRVLGGGNAITPMLATAAVAIGILAWIGLAVLQVKDAAIDAPLTPRISGAIAALLVLGAALWDGAAIRRLGGGLRR